MPDQPATRPTARDGVAAAGGAIVAAAGMLTAGVGDRPAEDVTGSLRECRATLMRLEAQLPDSMVEWSSTFADTQDGFNRCKGAQLLAEQALKRWTEQQQR